MRWWVLHVAALSLWCPFLPPLSLSHWPLPVGCWQQASEGLHWRSTRHPYGRGVALRPDGLTMRWGPLNGGICSTVAIRSGHSCCTNFQLLQACCAGVPVQLAESSQSSGLVVYGLLRCICHITSTDKCTKGLCPAVYVSHARAVSAETERRARYPIPSNRIPDAQPGTRGTCP